MQHDLLVVVERVVDQIAELHQLGGRDVISGIRLGIADVDQAIVGAVLDDPACELVDGDVIDLRLDAARTLLFPDVNAIVAEIRDVDATACDSDIGGIAKLFPADARLAEDDKGCSIRIERPDPTSLEVDSPHVSIAIDCDPVGDGDACDHLRGLACDEALKSVIIRVGNPNLTLRPDCDVGGVVELAQPALTGIEDADALVSGVRYEDLPVLGYRDAYRLP